MVCVHSLCTYVQHEMSLLSGIAPVWSGGACPRPALTCKNIRALSVAVSGFGGTERSFTVCSEFPCFRLYRL